jgi:polar amino acid transport system permease protein
MSTILAEWGDLLPELLPGVRVTLELTGAGLALGLPLGVLLALGAAAPARAIRWPVIALVEIGRGAPALILLYLVYFGLPQLHAALSSFLSAAIAIGLTTAAYSSEVFRAGLRAVDDGQREASRALGLSALDEFRLVVLPQALRIVIPPIIGLAIIVYQGTSLAYAVTVPELLSRAYNAGTITYQFLPPLTLAGVLYAAISLAGVALLRLRWPRRRWVAGPVPD